MIPTVRTALRRRGGRSARGGLVAMLVTVSLLAVAGLVGAAGTGQAATGFTVDLSPLIGSSGNDIPRVTFGGKIGYHLFVKNTGDSSTQHVSIVVRSSSATFFDADNPACSVGSTTKEMVCTPPGGALGPGDTFDVNLRFTAPSSAGQVSTTAFLTVSAQTVGGKKNNGTTLASDPTPVLTDVVADGIKNDTFLRKGEDAATGNLSATHKQNFAVFLPDTLFDDPFGIAVSIHDDLGSICTGCLPYYTELTIPAASDVLNASNPFYDPLAAMPLNPYDWSMSARYPSNSKPAGIVHVDADGVHNVPKCADIGGGPTTSDPLCWVTFVTGLPVPGPGSDKRVEATGKGLENGKIGFG